jgi:pSer/pThr/pTyr-binding forkhead associated (FHA) protein
MFGHLKPSIDLFPIIQLEENAKIRVGRSKNEKNIYLIDNKLVSGVHLEINILSKNTIEIIDKSSNGTYINNEKIGNGNKRILKNGDFIYLIESECKKFLFQQKIQ